MNYKQEILKSIQIMIDEKIGTYKADRTFVSVIKKVNPNGTYVVLDEAGGERTVKCCIPGVELKVGQRVYLLLPMGDLKRLHITGIV